MDKVKKYLQEHVFTIENLYLAIVFLAATTFFEMFKIPDDVRINSLFVFILFLQQHFTKQLASTRKVTSYYGNKLILEVMPKLTMCEKDLETLGKVIDVLDKKIVELKKKNND